MKKLVGLILMLGLVCTANATTFELLAHWDFAGAAGTTTVYDLVGARAATITGGASLDGSGGVNLAGGASGQYIDLGASFGNLIGQIESYRIEITFDWDGPATGGAQKWWSFTAGTTETTQFAMLTAVSSNNAYTRYQYRRDGSDTQANRDYSATGDIVDEMMTIAIEYDKALGTSGFGAIRTLKNGVLEAYASQTRDCSLSLLGNTTRNYIGNSPYYAGNPTGVKLFDGVVYDFKVYGVIPEPATMTLVGLGFMAFIRRRK
ncbi:MAG: PEP-CTERM sorting domain-containing protein [Phycisphaerales bacterium]